MTQTKKQHLGSWGEEQAALFLIRQGYKIEERNYKCSKGEIDIVAYKKEGIFKKKTLSFIEVKTRRGENGSAERAVGKKKLEQIFFSAKQYCIEYGIDIDRTPIQFEQISIYISNHTDSVKLVKYIIPI